MVKLNGTCIQSNDLTTNGIVYIDGNTTCVANAIVFKDNGNYRNGTVVMINNPAFCLEGTILDDTKMVCQCFNSLNEIKSTGIAKVSLGIEGNTFTSVLKSDRPFQLNRTKALVNAATCLDGNIYVHFTDGTYCRVNYVNCATCIEIPSTLNWNGNGSLTLNNSEITYDMTVTCVDISDKIGSHSLNDICKVDFAPKFLTGLEIKSYDHCWENVCCHYSWSATDLSQIYDARGCLIKYTRRGNYACIGGGLSIQVDETDSYEYKRCIGSFCEGTIRDFICCTRTCFK